MQATMPTYIDGNVQIEDVNDRDRLNEIVLAAMHLQSTWSAKLLRRRKILFGILLDGDYNLSSVSIIRILNIVDNYF